jgi:tetratricopeptide (TPR) repeat protein
MASERGRAEEIFNAALKIESQSERLAFLDDACAGDVELRRRIEALLHAHSDAGDFLEPPVIDAEATSLGAELTEGPGTTIGRYKLLQKIGEGGFGVVYMAEQEEPVRRRVALKIIKLGMDTKQVIARFEAERQALAMMDHPNIARVYDAGATETGRPYFVMELVKGIRITHYCDRNRLSTRERLELFIPVCRAIQHAHQKGIIHRDIKPSNVLVTLHDSTPVPKIIDFGIAKATSHRLTEKTLFTGFRQFIGTPEYMSPDQAAISGLDVDTRTDIYSLGVLLYELLTGSMPFDPESLRRASYSEILRIIREVEPPRPSARVSTLIHDGTDVATPRHTEPATLSKLMRGDLDWIVMKAMEKDRTRRYETASEFVHDIQRYLSHEQVFAAPPTVGYKMQKFVRRHRVGVVAGAIVALALVIGLSVATYGLLEARREAERSQRIADFLGELFISTSPEQALGRAADVEHVLTKARDLFGDDHATVAATLSSRALQLQSAGELEAAEQHYREALRIWRESEGDDTINVADTFRALGLLQSTMGDAEGAESSFREAIRITQSLGGTTLTHAETLGYLADVLSNRGAYAEAKELLRDAIRIRREVAPQQRLPLALAVNSLVSYTLLSGPPDSVHAVLQENLAAWRDALPPNGAVMAGALAQTATWYLSQNDMAEAEVLLNEALEIFRGLPQAPARYHYVALCGMESVLENRNDFTGVVPIAIEAVEVGAMHVDGAHRPGDARPRQHLLGHRKGAWARARRLRSGAPRHASVPRSPTGSARCHQHARCGSIPSRPAQ